MAGYEGAEVQPLVKQFVHYFYRHIRCGGGELRCWAAMHARLPGPRLPPAHTPRRSAGWLWRMGRR